MTTQEKRIWCIRAGRTGDAEELLLKKNWIVLGWADMGDLGVLPNTRDAFKNHMTDRYPDMKPGTVHATYGQLYRFVYELQIGDIVIYPSKQDRMIHVGQVTSAYQYVSEHNAHYPHRRTVKWIKSVSRTLFTQGALYEIGSALSFFQVKEYADEFIAVVTNKQSSELIPVDRDATVGLVAEEIEQTTRDFVLKTLAQELKGHPFAAFIEHLLNKMGYRTRLSKAGPDGGIDIIAHKDELGFEPPIIKVQVKSNENSIGAPDVQALVGNIGSNTNEYGLFVTLGKFTSQAKNFARGNSKLRLIEGDELVDLIFTYYEEFDPRYKAVLPLKRVYIPQTLTDDN
jgi:restriction system protein